MKYLHHLILFSCVLSFCTCNDFLDVTSSEKILQKDLFKESQGIRMAVNGVYKEMSSTSLYGQNLSWGFISAVGHNYEVTTSVLTTNLYYAANFAWDNSYVESITDNIWSKAYNIIANCNNIIQMVEEQDTMFFKEKALEKTLILGEMYGVRAMLHFDLFRLFAPAPITNASGLTIPYVTTYPDKRPINLSSDEVLKNIVDDMEMAKTMLAPIDTIKFRSVISSPAGRYRQSNTWRNLPEGDFFNYRGQRMNFLPRPLFWPGYICTWVIMIRLSKMRTSFIGFIREIGLGGRVQVIKEISVMLTTSIPSGRMSCCWFFPIIRTTRITTSSCWNRITVRAGLE